MYVLLFFPFLQWVTFWYVTRSSFVLALWYHSVLSRLLSKIVFTLSKLAWDITLIHLFQLQYFWVRTTVSFKLWRWAEVERASVYLRFSPFCIKRFRIQQTQLLFYMELICLEYILGDRASSFWAYIVKFSLEWILASWFKNWGLRLSIIPVDSVKISSPLWLYV